MWITAGVCNARKSTRKQSCNRTCNRYHFKITLAVVIWDVCGKLEDMNERFSQSRQLNWDATYEIVLHLKEAHPDVDIETLGLEQLFQYGSSLSQISQMIPELANEGILNEILREWYEEDNP